MAFAPQEVQIMTSIWQQKTENIQECVGTKNSGQLRHMIGM
jgi:hypothetical protein